MTPTIDLHGKTQDEAIDYLGKQLTVCKLKGSKWVTVITGRGHGSKKGVDLGKLKQRVPKWLTGVKFKSLVKAIHEVDGNPGAYLIEIKQKKKPAKPKLRVIKP